MSYLIVQDSAVVIVALMLLLEPLMVIKFFTFKVLLLEIDIIMPK